VSAELPCYKPPSRETRACWNGRDDGDDSDVQRWHQAINFIDLSKPLDYFFEPTICFIGYASDLGVRENLGRAGAADGPARLRVRMASFPVVEGVALADCGDILAGATVLETQEALATVVAVSYTHLTLPTSP
jgi:formiminoglutamase